MMSDLHSRLRSATGKTTYRRLGELTDTHPETVRRYMQGQSPSAPFLAHVCDAFGICGEWLLTGQGPMRIEEVRRHALKGADASELLGAIAGNLTNLNERMERLERQVQGLETWIRAISPGVHIEERSAVLAGSGTTDAAAAERHGTSVSGLSNELDDAAQSILQSEQAIGRIREAVAKRASLHSDRVGQADQS